MNLKEKIKNKGFWLSLMAVFFMFAQTIGWKVDEPFVMSIINTVLLLLVTLGIISDADKGDWYED